jgi:UDP-N-acetylmuramoyl-L-alanyl-D-glutamate--2,6-diaminopimelate ligase
VCLNSQHIQDGDVFIALQGQSTYGIKHINQAIENGCVAVLIDSEDIECRVPTIRIDDLESYMPVLAKQMYADALRV